MTASTSDSLINYPSQFPVKVMGPNVAGFADAVVAVAQRFDPGLNSDAVTTRHSSAGKYVAVSVTVTATSREQLDALYLALTAHPLVKVVVL